MDIKKTNINTIDHIDVQLDDGEWDMFLDTDHISVDIYDHAKTQQSNVMYVDDVCIDGVSLKKTLQGLNERLAILQCDPELEAEFDELHSLAEQYRALEKKIIEKQRIWQALNNS